jgi:hypothetical protein
MLSVSILYSVDCRMIDKYGLVDRMTIGNGNQSTWRKTALMSLFHYKSHMQSPGSEPEASWIPQSDTVH